VYSIATEQQNIPGQNGFQARAHFDRGAGAERSRESSPHREARGQLRRRALLDPLGSHGVIVGELLELPVAKTVDARVPDVSKTHRVAANERGHHRRTHPSFAAVLCCGVLDAAIGLLDRGDEPRQRIARRARFDARQRDLRIVVNAFDRGDRDRRGQLARGMTAHAVHHDEEAEVIADEQSVLVGFAHPADVGASGSFESEHSRQGFSLPEVRRGLG
jgi:hypothetical protein